MKIEFDIPEFEKELSVSIVIRKDGEVVCEKSASPSPTKTMPVVTKKDESEKKAISKKNTGNFMDANLFDD